MNTRRLILPLVLMFSASIAPLRAQLVHLTLGSTEGFFQFKSWNADSLWDHASGHVTQIEIRYDTQAQWGEDTFPDPSKLFLRFQVTGPDNRTFEFARPLNFFGATEQSMSFFYAGLRDGYDEEVQVILEFAAPLMTQDGFSFPIPPIPDLDDFKSSYFLKGGQAMFPEPDVVEAYGSGQIYGAVSAMFVPVPEPSTYAIAGVLLAMVAIGVQRRRPGREMSTTSRG